ncbi:MAG: hypothetical protein IKB93_04635 [Clostridia bacterium]|nr:hypothetical protein [Clostridia bacterium]
MKNNDNFDINSFIFPDASYAPVYVWVWNDICTREIIDNQLSEMKDLGIRAFYILPEPKNFRPDSMPTNLTPDYLSKEFFELCAYALNQGVKLGMRCWIYDEGGWPSGGACGKVLKDHPEYARQELKAYEKNYSSGEIYKKSSPEVLGAFLNDSKIIDEGYIFTENSVITEYIVKQEISGERDYPDLLNKEATEYFIETTHKKYASELKNLLGKNVTAVFTDEPKAPSVPFNKLLMEKYEALYNESILPHLPLISKRKAPTEENAHILHRWYDLCSHIFCENFLLTCKKWANNHHIAFTGHMDVDHSPLGCVNGGGNFNLMRALRCFDIPGIDIIWRQLYPENKSVKTDEMNCYNGFFPRYASSAAAQNGTKFAMSEIFGVAGPGLTYDIMRYTIGYQAVRGINIFNPFNFPLGRTGALLAQELPVFTVNQPYYTHLHTFNRYAERLSYISSLGERVCETGLYYPVHDFHSGLNAKAISNKFDTLGRTLEDLMIDFDIVDDDVIQTADITDGCLRIGNASYSNIIIPEGAFIPSDTKKALNHFIECGGKVSHFTSGLLPTIQVEGKGLRAMHRKTENEHILCLFREKGENEEFLVKLPSKNGYFLNLLTGTLQHLETQNNVLHLSLQVGETAVILLTDKISEAETERKFLQQFNIKNEFMFCKKLELTCSENGFENIKHPEKLRPLCLGDWSSAVGNAYSGSGIYKTTFSLPAEKAGKEGIIDLGDVHFIAQAYLNNELLGTVLMPPYRFKIPAEILAESNELKIIVTNTSANWYAHTDYFSKWTTNELSPYFEAELNYAKDYATGGLYGPVTVYTE